MNKKIKIDVLDISETCEIDSEVIGNWEIEIADLNDDVFLCKTGVSTFYIKKHDYYYIFPKKEHYRPLPEGIEILRSDYLSDITGKEELGLFVSKDIPEGIKWMTHVKTTDPIFDNGLIRLPMGGFFNHNSINPNCKAVHTDQYVYLETLRDIKSGEELTAKYTLYNPEE